MSTHRKKVPHLVALIMALAASSSFASTEPARLISAAGDVTVAGQSLTRGAAVSVGQTIKIGHGANAQLRLSDGTVVSLKEDSSYEVKAPQVAQTQEKSSLQSGIEALSDHTTVAQQTLEESPVTVIGIRGALDLSEDNGAAPSRSEKSKLAFAQKHAQASLFEASKLYAKKNP